MARNEQFAVIYNIKVNMCCRLSQRNVLLSAVGKHSSCFIPGKMTKYESRSQNVSLA